MSNEITTAAELADYPPGSTFTARSGEVWMLERVHTMGSTNDLCAHLASPETPHASSTDVLRKWGPLTLQWRPDQPPATAEPATVKPSVEAVAEVLYGQFTRNRIAEWDDITDDSDQPRYAWLHAARAILALLPGRTETQVKAEALREYAAARYEAYLEQPETPWFEQPSDLAKRYAKAAVELRDEADRIEWEG